MNEIPTVITEDKAGLIIDLLEMSQKLVEQAYRISTLIDQLAEASHTQSRS